MKILHVISSMAQEAGGPPGICAGMAGGLAGRGHALTIATAERPGGADRKSLVEIPEGATVKFFEAAPGSYASAPDMGKWLDEHARDFDIVHLHSIWQYPTFAAARACWKAKVPYV